MTDIGLDRDPKADIGVAAANSPQLMVTGIDLDDWLASHDNGSQIVFTDSTGTSATHGIPSGFNADHVGGGVWTSLSDPKGVIEESGVSTLSGDTGNLPMGKGLTRAIAITTNPNSSGSFDPTTDINIRNYDYPAAGSESGVACSQDFDAVPSGVTEGTETSSDTVTNNTATLLFAGNSSLIFREVQSTSVTSNSETRGYTIKATVSCPVPWQFEQEVTGNTQAAPNYGTENRSPTLTTVDVNNTAGPNTYTDITYAYNQVTDAVIALPTYLGIEANVSISPIIGSVNIPVSLSFPATNLTSGSFTRDRDVDEVYTCRGTYEGADNGVTPCNVPSGTPSGSPAWFAQKGLAVDVSGSTTTDVYDQTWNYARSSKWDGFVGSEVAYVEQDGAQFTRYRGTITATTPTAPAATGQLTSSSAVDQRANIPGGVTVTQITVNFTSQETVDFDWHFDQGINLYSIGSPDSIPDNPATCNMIGNADGSITIIASKIAPTITEGTEADNYYEEWTVSSGGAISLGSVTTYQYLGMGSPDLTMTLCWPLS